MAYTLEDIQKVLGTTDNYYTPKELPVQNPENKRYSVEDVEAVVGKSSPASPSAVSSSVNATKSATGRKTSSTNKRKVYPSKAEKQVERLSRLRKVADLKGTNAPIASDPLSLTNGKKQKDNSGEKDDRVIPKSKENVVAKAVAKAFEGPTFEEAKQKTKEQPKKKQASTYLSGDMQPSTGVSVAANKQVDRSVPKRQVLKEFDAAQMETYMDPEYRMDGREKSGAKKYIEHYYKTAKGFAGGPFKALENAQYRANWSDDEQRQYDQIVSLENKLKGGTAFMAGMAQASGAIPAAETIGEKAAKIVTGKNSDLSGQLEKQMDLTSRQNPLESMAGQMVGQASKYAFTKQMLGQIPGYDKLNQKVAGKLGKYGQNVADVLADTTVDAVAETIPQMIGNARSGMGAGKVAAEAGKNLAQNLGWNVLGEVGSVAAKKIPDILDYMKGTGETATKAPVNNHPELGNLGTISAADEADLLAQAKKLPSVDEATGKAASDAFTGGSGTMTSKQIDNIISNPAARKEFEQATGQKLTGTKAEMRKLVRNTIDADAVKKEAYPVSNADSIPRASQTEPEFTSSAGRSSNATEKINTEIPDKANTEIPDKANTEVSDMQIYNILNDENLQKEFTKRTGVKLEGSREEMEKTIRENISPTFGAKEFAAMDKANAGNVIDAAAQKKMTDFSTDKRASVNALKSDLAAYNMPDNMKIQAKKLQDELTALVDEIKTGQDSTAALENVIDKAAELDRLLKSGAVKQVPDEFNTKAYNDVVGYLRGVGKPIYVSPAAAAEFPDGVKALNNQFSAYGRGINFTTNQNKGVSLDSIIDELSAITGFKSTGNDINDLKNLTDYIAERKAGRMTNVPYAGDELQMFIGNVSKNFDSAMDLSNKTSAGKDLKVSQVRSNTLQNSGLMTETEMAKYAPEDMYRYATVSEKESMSDAAFRVSLNPDWWRDKILAQESLDGKDLDTLMMLYRDKIEKARIDNDAALWDEASKLLKDIQKASTRAGQQIQALAKWSRDTPEGAIVDGVRKVSKAVEKKYGKGYADAVEGLAEKVEEAVKNSATPEDAEKAVKNLLNLNLQFFATDKVKGKLNGKNKILQAVRSGEDWAKVGELIRKENSVYLNPIEQKDIYTLLEEALKYDVQSRQSKELVAKAAKMVADKIPASFGSQIKTLLYDNMLGNFKTALSRNAFGNAAYNVLEQSRQPIAALVDRAVSLGTKERTTSGWTKDKTVEYIKGLGRGFSDELKDIKSGVNTSRRGFDTFSDAVDANRKAYNGNGALSKLMNGIDNIVSHGMSMGDRPFYEAAYSQAKVELKDLVKKYGADVLTKDAGENIDEFIDATAKLKALEAVFQDDSVLYQALKGFKESAGKLSEGVIGVDLLSQTSSPFIKTPGNMLSRALEYSPFGVAKNVVNTAKEMRIPELGGFNQRRFVDETSRNLMGTGILAGTIAAARNGLTTGGYSEDADEAQAQRNAGMLEYAIQLPDGRQVDAGDIPVLGPMIEAGAKINEQGLAKGATQALGAIVGGSAMQGINRLFGGNSGYSSGEENIFDRAIDTLGSSVTQLAPSLGRQVAQTMDPYKRDMGEYGTLDYYDNMFKNQIPFLRQTLPIKYDEEGNPVLQNQGREMKDKVIENFLAPMNISEYQPSELTKEASRLLKSTGENIAFVPKAKRSDVKELYGDDYSEDKFRQYKQDYGKMKSDAGTALMQTDMYKGMDDVEKAGALQDVYSAMKAAIKSKITGEKPKDKLAQIYLDRELDGMLEYMALDESASMFKNKDGSEKSFGSASAAEKIKLMEQQGLSQSEMGGYLYSPDAGKGVKSAYSKYGNEGVYNYYNIKANADYDGNGSLKKDEVTSYLDGNGFSEEEKRMYFEWLLPNVKKNPY